MCTNFLIRVGDDKYVNGRSMEFGANLKSKLFFRAAGHRFSAAEFGEYGLEWTGNYNVVGMNTNGLPLICDGMNDQGLATGDLWLPGSQYQAITDRKLGLSIDRFAMWVLSSFADVLEVKAALVNNEVQVGAAKFVQNLLPLHFPIHDAAGRSIVVEFTGGEMMVYDNPIGTLTNQPTFPWQMENLRNFVDVSPWDAPTVTFAPVGPKDWCKENWGDGGFDVSPTGHGSGMMHLPGDPTPPSRFVKAAMLSHFANPVSDLDEGVDLAFHVLNTVDIPKGQNKFKGRGDKTESDYTQWVVVKDLSRKIYFSRFYGSPQVYALDLAAISEADWAKLDGKQVAVPSSPFVTPMNASLPPAMEGGLLAMAEPAGPLRVVTGDADGGM